MNESNSRRLMQYAATLKHCSDGFIQQKLREMCPSLSVSETQNIVAEMRGQEYVYRH